MCVGKKMQCTFMYVPTFMEKNIQGTITEIFFTKYLVLYFFNDFCIKSEI